MATRLFLNDAANSLTGTFPSTPQSSVVTPISQTVLNLGTVRTMRSLTGTTMQTRTFTSSPTTATQRVFHGYFCSDTLDVDQQIVPQRVALNVANYESNLNMDYGEGLTLNAYVWRPGSGSLVGTIADGLSLVGVVEPNNSALLKCNRGSCTSTVTVSAAAGDVIICEVYQVFASALATAYIGRFGYDGTTVNTTSNATVTNHASYFELKTSTLTFGTPAATTISCSFANTLATVALSGVGSSPINGSFNNSLASVALSGAATLGPPVGTFSNTLADATVSAAGTVGDVVTGSFNNTLSDATVSGVGSSPRNATFANTLATVALSATASVPHTSTFNNTLAAVSLAGASTVPVNSALTTTLGTATLSATAAVSAGAPAVGSFLGTLTAATLQAVGTAGAQQPVVSAPSDGGSGAASSRRAKFVVPLEALQASPVDALLDNSTLAQADPLLPPAPAPEKSGMSLARALAASLPPPAPTTVPKQTVSTKVAPRQGYTDEDMIMIALLI